MAETCLRLSNPLKGSARGVHLFDLSANRRSFIRPSAPLRAPRFRPCPDARQLILTAKVRGR
jgi:hypothetical protein